MSTTPGASLIASLKRHRREIFLGVVTLTVATVAGLAIDSLRRRADTLRQVQTTLAQIESDATGRSSLRMAEIVTNGSPVVDALEPRNRASLLSRLDTLDRLQPGSKLARDVRTASEKLVAAFDEIDMEDRENPLSSAQYIVWMQFSSLVRREAGTSQRAAAHAARQAQIGTWAILLAGVFLISLLAAWHGSERRRAHAYASAADRDPLTGLVNHGAFQRALRGAGDEGDVALVMLDLDRFKSINDTHGHPFGDTVLSAVAARLRSVARPDDVLGRVGGEEFALLLAGVDGVQAEHVADRICQAVRAEPILGIDVTVSAGVCLRSDVHGRDLYVCADEALYAAKAAGRDCFRRYRRALESAA